MIEEPAFPSKDPPELPPDVEHIISQLKLLYFIGGEDTVRIALAEAGVVPPVLDDMMEALRMSVESGIS